MFSSLTFLYLYITHTYDVYDFRYIEEPIHLLIYLYFLYYILQNIKLFKINLFRDIILYFNNLLINSNIYTGCYECFAICNIYWKTNKYL